MTIDLTGGMDPSSDHFLAARPDDPQFRESASMWISDDEGVDRAPADRHRGGGGVVGQARPPGEPRVPRRAGGRRARIGRGALPRRRRRRLPHVRGRWPRVPPRRAVQDVDRDLRRHRARHHRRHALARGELDAPPHPAARSTSSSTCAAPPWVPGTMNDDAAEVFHQGLRGRVHQPPLRAAVHLPRHRARRRRRMVVHRHRPAHPPPGRARRRRLLGPLLAERVVPERARASAASRSPNAPTASPPTTRRTCSTASA